MHCSFNEGLLRSCNRIRFNKYYQDADEFNLAWQVSSNSNPHISTTSELTDRQQRGIVTIVPHAFAGT